MKLVRQPPGSNQCGQACVAMILGISLEDAIELVGKKGSTRTRDIVTALESRGRVCGQRLKKWKPIRRPYPSLYLSKVRWPFCRWRSHWVVAEYTTKHFRRIFDPSLEEISCALQTFGFISSELRVEK